MTSRKSLVDPKFARGKMYKKAMEEIVAEGVCPFCPEHFKWHTKPILRYENDWFITENFKPYENAKYHFLIISKTHHESLSELSSKDLISVFDLARWAVVEYNIPGGGITLRFGDSNFTGATIKHLHFHLLSPERKNGKTKPVYFPIG